MTATVHNEQVKLSANGMNTTAVTLGAAGAITPLIASSYNSQFQADAVSTTRMMVWVAAALTIHIIARATLANIRDD